MSNDKQLTPDIRAIIRSFEAMKKSSAYLSELEKYLDKFGSDLPEEEKSEWWVK